MPIALALEELQPGMRLARPIRNQWVTLVTAGTVLTADQIARLQGLGLDTPVLVVDPLLDSKVEFADDTPDQETALRVHREMVSTLAKVEDRFRQTTNLSGAEFVALQEVLVEVVREIEKSTVQSAFLLKAQSADEYIKFHAANVFYLSMLMGKELRAYIFQERLRQTASDRISRGLDLTPLGTGALLHDIGMIPLMSIVRRSGRLPAEDLERVRQHPVEGARAIPEGCSPLVRVVVRQHHESADGSGYPDGRVANDTHIFARVVRVADAFDAGTSQTLYREAKPAWRVLHEMAFGAWKAQFDSTLTKVFLSVIQPFPTGSRVRLSSGEYAVVVKHNPRHPFAPWVIVAFDANGGRLPAERLRPPIDLSATSQVRLHSFGSELLGPLYRSTSALVTRRPPAQATTAFELAYP